MSKEKISRREFLEDTGRGAGALFSATTLQQAPLLPRNTPQEIVSALGDTLIPTDPGDPGYRSLEPHGITDEVLKGLEVSAVRQLEELNKAARAFYDGRTLVGLLESERTAYLESIIEGTRFQDSRLLSRLRSAYSFIRSRVFLVYYQNYPEIVRRDAQGLPIPVPGDTHQIINPNTKELVTGWDGAHFEGPWSWQQEEDRRRYIKTLRWDTQP